jgi:hypothetical protein
MRVNQRRCTRRSVEKTATAAFLAAEQNFQGDNVSNGIYNGNASYPSASFCERSAGVPDDDTCPPTLDRCDTSSSRACLDDDDCDTRSTTMDLIDRLPLPGFIKNMIRNALLEDMPEAALQVLPSEGKAAKTIHQFQKHELCGERLTSGQMDQMARTGYLTKKDGTTIAVPSDVQCAAKRFMMNGGELFKKMESATNGKHDGQLGLGDYHKALHKGRISDGGPNYETVYTPINHLQALPSETGAAKTVNEFQHCHLGGGRISVAQMDEMARTGYLTKNDGTIVKVSPEMQDAARRFMANDAELFKKMESATDGKFDGQLGTGDFYEALKSGRLSGGGSRLVAACMRDDILPSEADAAGTIHHFQKHHLGGAQLSVGQMEQMARTGYLTRADGCTVPVPPEVQNAARRFMADGAELFKKMESATDGIRDGRLGMGDYHKALDRGLIDNDDLGCDIVCRRSEFAQPTEASAAKSIHDFQMDRLGGERLSASQVDEMARTGYLQRADGSTVRVPDDIQAAAQRFMTNGGELFRKMESATDGNLDGQLGVGDYDEAIAKGRIFRSADKREIVAVREAQVLPSESDAARTIHNFQNEALGGDRISIGQMDQIARTGYCTKADGTTFQVTPQEQAAAQRFMANDAALFKKMESATDGNFDGKLGAGDYQEARTKGIIAGNPGDCDIVMPCDQYELPSASGAARKIHDFQQNALGGDRISAAQMDQMARTGYCTKSDGSTIAVPPDIQDAAKRFMAHDAALFRKMESATDGRHDGQLGLGDYDRAIAHGVVHPHHGHCPVKSSADHYLLPSESDAARTIHDFQNKALGGDRVSIGQMDQIARTGYCTKSDGSTFKVTPQEQAAAQRFMAHDAALFKKMESATDGKFDGKLGTGDYHEAIEDGTISKR